MRAVIGLAVLAAMGVSPVATAATGAASVSARLAPCARLADYARGLRHVDWDKRGDKAFLPALTFAKAEQVDVTAAKHPAPGSPAAIARLPMVKKALDDADYSVLEVEHLRKSGLFQVDNVEGTLHCHYLAFLRAGKATRVVGAPPAEREPGDLCWTNTGDLATLYGRPAFVVHDQFSGTLPDDHIIVTPWTGAGWGAACETDLHFDTTVSISERYCGDVDVCRRATRVAKSIVVAYDRKRSGKDDISGFMFGKAAPAPVQAVMQQALAGRSDTHTPDFPTFGVKVKEEDEFNLSYNGFVYFPLELDGLWYGAAIARNGVGWREDDNTLLVIYDLEAGWTKPLASFVLPVSVTRLVSAKAIIPPPPKDK